MKRFRAISMIASAVMNLRRFFSRVGLLSREAGIIRGICRQLEWYAHHKNT
jgi:tRNA/rRNA methyltransferase